ncbi:hypothetical protein RFI_14524 [Reticulomyxa filosa]|uniref:Uncharacterized protein n=1 Tax=Reticulomyxa filosa TaxID=46433 RepID=X6NA74_RETFI|nr:hypothetical protein RFI_14524 [Reticulomyxa filosa]|eukprot:ETO22669.1 hypothetical protein RFI_14524 [Reticulomyxa filosa]
MCKKCLLPALSKHLIQDLNIIPLLCHFWFHALFTYDTSENLPDNERNDESHENVDSCEYLTLRVWDVLIGAQHMDITFVLKMGLSILIFYQNELLAMNSEQIMFFLKTIDLSKLNFLIPLLNRKQSNSKKTLYPQDKSCNDRAIRLDVIAMKFGENVIARNGFKNLDVDHCIRLAMQEICIDQEITHKLRNL